MRQPLGQSLAFSIGALMWSLGCQGQENLGDAGDTGSVPPDSDSVSGLTRDIDIESDADTTTQTEPSSDTGSGVNEDTESETGSTTAIDTDTTSNTDTPSNHGSEMNDDTGSDSESETAGDTDSSSNTTSSEPTDKEGDTASETAADTDSPSDTTSVVHEDTESDTESETATDTAPSNDTDSETIGDAGSGLDTDTQTHVAPPVDTATLSDNSGYDTETFELFDGGPDAGPPTDGPFLDPRPNILLIVVDDLGYADFEPFGHHDPEVSTPNLSRLADSGIVFTEAYTTGPVCSPSRAGFNTGKNQIRWDEDASWIPGLPAGVKTIAEYLREAGYETACIGKSDFGTYFHRTDVREYPLNHGYDEFLGFSAHGHDYWLLSTEIRDRTPDPHGTSAALGPLMHNTGEKSYDEGYLTDILTDEAVHLIERPRDRPLFLTLSYNAVHHLIHEAPTEYLNKYDVEPIANYDPDDMVEFGSRAPGSYLAYYDKYSRLGAINEEEMRKLYLANLNALDDNIGRVLNALVNSGLSEKTLTLFLSDNGGSPLTGASNAPLTAGKYSLWEGGIRVPMVLSWPGRLAAGVAQTQYVSTTDILPTIAEAADIDIDDETIDGRHLLFPDTDRLLVWQWQDTWAVRKGEWKLTNTDEDHWKGDPSAQYIEPISDDLSIKLFNLRDDTGERLNLVDIYPEKVEELQTAYQDWCDNHIGRY